MTMSGTAILKNEPITGAILAARTFLAEMTRCTTRKSVVQYPMESTAPRPKTIPTHWTPIGLSAKWAIGRHMWVKSWLGKFWWMRATTPDQPPDSVSPRIGMSNAPNQMRKNCTTSLKIAEKSPPSATYTPTVSEETQMLKFRFHPSITFITRAMANMLTPDIRMVITAKDTALRPLAARP